MKGVRGTCQDCPRKKLKGWARCKACLPIHAARRQLEIAANAKVRWCAAKERKGKLPKPPRPVRARKTPKGRPPGSCRNCLAKRIHGCAWCSECLAANQARRAAEKKPPVISTKRCRYCELPRVRQLACCQECLPRHLEEKKLESLAKAAPGTRYFIEQGLCSKCGKRAARSNKRLCEHCAAVRASATKSSEQRSKLLIYEAYGHECSCCGERREALLSIEHVGGWGREHRKGTGATSVYNWIIRNDFPDSITLLCMSCNHARGRQNNLRGRCPHELERESSIAPVLARLDKWFPVAQSPVLQMAA